MRCLIVMLVCSFISVSSFALGYQDDPSKPTENTSVTTFEKDVFPVTAGTQERWKIYDSPIRKCIPGDTLLPSSGAGLFEFLFHNNSESTIKMNIQGWHKKQCQIIFSEGSHVLNCQFQPSELRSLMLAILSAEKFDSASKFAQTLSKNCQPGLNA